MQTRLIKLRFRRRFRKGQRQVEDLSGQAEEHIDKHLLGRFDRLKPIRRFVFGWLSLMFLIIGVLIAQNQSLSAYYQSLKPIPGGFYSEGVIGRFTTASPLFATSDADSTVSKLIFSGLFNYDQNGDLTPDLAKSMSVDDKGSTYTIILKPDLKWQDGEPLTSKDIVFTYKTIQNPDVKSPLQSAWSGIEVTAPDENTVVFKLPGALAAFPYGLTNGIVPEHILGKVTPVDMRTTDFNTLKPVGSGPFKWETIKVDGDGNPKNLLAKIVLNPFADYQAGEPKLQQFTVEVYASQEKAIDTFKSNQLTGLEGLTEVPEGLSDNVIVHSLPLRAANMVFFKTTSGVLSDATVRKALVLGANVPEITKSLDYETRLVREPILIGQTGYDRTLAQAKFDLKTANSTLDAAGWQVNNISGYRSKEGKTLSFTISVTDTPEYRMVVNKLKKQWEKIGVKLDVQYLNASDLQNVLANHSYEAILYGIAIGSDPDVFVYWDSSQADIRSANRLNLSEYKNTAADAALEAGRTRIDPTLRTIKYKPFLQAWQNDNPALGLYQPRLIYLTNGQVFGLNDSPINTPADRLSNVHNWQIRQAKVTN